MKKLMIFLLALMMLACAKDDDLELENGIQAETTESFTTKAKKKVTICHFGKTLDVPVKTVDKHLDHGDYLGSCTPCPTGISDLDQVCGLLDTLMNENPPLDNYRCYRNNEFNWVKYSIVNVANTFFVEGLKVETGQINFYYVYPNDSYVLVYHPGEEGYSEAELLYNFIREKVISVIGYDCGAEEDCNKEPWNYPKDYKFFEVCEFLANVDLERFICYSRTTTFGTLSEVHVNGQYGSHNIKMRLSTRDEELPDRPDAQFVLDVEGLEYFTLTYLEGSFEYDYILNMMTLIRNLAWTNGWENTYDNCGQPWVLSCCEGFCEPEPWTYPIELEFYELCDYLDNVVLDRYICYTTTTTFGTLSGVHVNGQYESQDIHLRLSTRDEDLPDRPDAEILLDVPGLGYFSSTYLEGSPEYDYISNIMTYTRRLAWSRGWENTYDGCGRPDVLSCCERNE